MDLKEEEIFLRRHSTCFSLIFSRFSCFHDQCNVGLHILVGLDFFISPKRASETWLIFVVQSSIGSGLFSRLYRVSYSLHFLEKAFLGLWALDFEPRTWDSKNCQFVNSILVTGPESLPTESSCRSDNCARILVYKLSESGNTTFSIYHNDDAS